jgi:hypothetical protein
MIKHWYYVAYSFVNKGGASGIGTVNVGRSQKITQYKDITDIRKWLLGNDKELESVQILNWMYLKNEAKEKP